MMKCLSLTVVYLLASTSALAASPRSPPCQKRAGDRDQWPNGTLLWGTARQAPSDEASTVLESVNLGDLRLASGAVLQGKASDGKPVEVAVCSADADAKDPALTRYSIEIWHAESATWKNPCIATHQAPSPRALVVPGVWSPNGAWSEAEGSFTFACEGGAIAKCIDWGYKPWATQAGQSLAELHQACTRMARADYCGNGRSHTHEDTPIDVYDVLQLLTRTQQATVGGDARKDSFEAAWTPEGAACLARTRDGQALESIMKECPERFEAAAKSLSEGDSCVLVRKGAKADEAPLRNHSYSQAPQAPLSLRPGVSP